MKKGGAVGILCRKNGGKGILWEKIGYYGKKKRWSRWDFMEKKLREWGFYGKNKILYRKKMGFHGENGFYKEKQMEGKGFYGKNVI